MEKPRVNQKKVIKRLFKEIFDKRVKYFILMLICIIISASTTVYISTILQTLIDSYIVPLMTSEVPDFTPLIIIIFKWALIMLVGIFASYSVSRIMLKIGNKTIFSLRNKTFKKMQSLPISYFDKNKHGDLMSLYTNDIDAVEMLLSEAIASVISSLLTVILVLVAMFINNWILALVILATTALTLFTIKFIAGKSSKNFKAQQDKLAKANAYIEEMMAGSRVVKTFTREESSIKEFDEINQELCKATTKANSYANMMMPIAGNLGNLQYVILVFIGSVITLLTPYSVGALAAFLQLARSFTNPISQLAAQMNSFLSAIAGADRIFNLLDEEAEVDEGYVTLVKKEDGYYWHHPHQNKTVTETKVEGHIELNDVDFAYVEGKLILKDIKLWAKAGQKIAFVGSTGAGKTTITNLLNRFYDIQDGKIRIDGININKIKKADLRRSLGYVLQDTNLFSGTVKDNIRYGKLDATDEEIIAAAKLANAHDFIIKLENGYDTLIKDSGASLSQGQRQLLSIARAAVMDPPIMVLDEATSSIDTHTEKLVQQGMDSLMKGRTVFVIAHRLSTVRNSDAIMVLENGEIVERGDHEDLINQGGRYYKLYTGAFELT